MEEGGEHVKLDGHSIRRISAQSKKSMKTLNCGTGYASSKQLPFCVSAWFVKIRDIDGLISLKKHSCSAVYQQN